MISGYSFELSVGILPYPITFLVTDIISEIYGRKKADQVVLAGWTGVATASLVSGWAQSSGLPIVPRWISDLLSEPAPPQPYLATAS